MFFVNVRMNGMGGGRIGRRRLTILRGKDENTTSKKKKSALIGKRKAQSYE